MHKKEILILGASVDQLEFYLQARAMGLYIIGVDRNKNAPALPLSDEQYYIPINDYEQIKQTLKNRDIQAVISPACDTAQYSIYELSRFFNTPFKPSLESTKASAEKAYFMDFLKHHGLPHYRYAIGHSWAELENKISELRYPLVVKPNDNSGSKGVLWIENASDLPQAVKNAFQYSPCHQVLIEEFIMGMPVSVDTYIVNGRPAYLCISEKVLTPFPHLIPIQYITPARVESRYQEKMKAIVEDVCRGLQIESGPITFDVVLSKGDVYIIELGVRLPGNALSKLVRYSYAVNPLEAVLQLNLGMPLQMKPEFPKRIGLYIIHSTKNGVVTRIDHDTPYKLAHVLEIDLKVKEGDRVFAYTQAAYKLGFIIASHPDAEKIEEIFQQVIQTMGMEINE